MEASTEIQSILMELATHRKSHFPVKLPNMENTEWEVKNFEIDEHDVFMANLRAMRDGNHFLCAEPGKYVALIKKCNERGERETVMSNTQLEYRTNIDFVNRAAGRLLITGLGLGMILRPLAVKPEVTSITVIEKSDSLIDMMRPYVKHIPKLSIVEGDAFTLDWPRNKAAGKPFDMAWHDIWSSFGGHELLAEYAKMKRKWKPFVYGEQKCWAEDLTRRELRRRY